MKHFHIAAIAIASALFTQPSLADSVSVQVNRGNVSVGIDVGTPPPAPMVETVPPPRPGQVWVPGYWNWDGHRHVWVKGGWVKERPGYSYAPGRWEQRGNRWHFQPGGWNRVRERRHEEHRRHDEYRDRDGRRGRDEYRDRDEMRDHDEHRH